MGARAEALAKQFETKAQEASGVLERLSDADWKKTTAAEQWTVGVVAHHVASGHETIAGLAKTVADGKPLPNLTMDALHSMNAQHAKDNASCTKAETVALHKKNAAAAVAIVREMNDADLDRSAALLSGMPAMTVAEVVEHSLIGHVQGQLGNVRARVGA